MKVRDMVDGVDHGRSFAGPPARAAAARRGPRGAGARRFEPTPFAPFPGLAGPHRQTIAARLVRGRLAARYARERIATTDDDFLDLDVWAGEVATPERAVCLVLHGLEGRACSGYMVSASRALAARGIRAVSLNFRSCSGEPNRAPESYHAGRTDDVARALDWVAGRQAGVPLLLLGFSLGGNVMLKLLGEFGDDAGRAGGGALDGRPAGAAAISVPYDLAACAGALERGAGRLYARRFLRSLRAKTRQKAARHPDRFDLAALAGVRTLREFDDRVTAPLHGFRDAAHYYGACSAAGFVDRVRVPTLLIHARDDPLAPSASIPGEAVRRNPFLQLALTGHGGHVGFLAAGPGVRPWTWAEHEAARFLHACATAAAAPHPRELRV